MKVRQLIIDIKRLVGVILALAPTPELNAFGKETRAALHEALAFQELLINHRGTAVHLEFTHNENGPEYIPKNPKLKPTTPHKCKW